MSEEKAPIVTVTKDCKIAYRGHTVYELTKGENAVESADVAAELQAQADALGYGKAKGKSPKTKDAGASPENKDAGESPENK